MVTLQNAIKGLNISDLGNSKSTYLSYETKNGWSVIRFDRCYSFIQKIFRYLGFYSSTHLTTIAAHLSQERSLPDELCAKINASWGRKHGHINTTDSAEISYPGFDKKIGNTHVKIEQGDIMGVNMGVIVNAANEGCLGGSGIDGAIHQAAGAGLLAECQRLPEVSPGRRCKTGKAIITGSHNLSSRGIQQIIHAVGPRFDWNSQIQSATDLKGAYESSLDLARQGGVRSIAFPAISTGIFGYPFDEATQIAICTIQYYLTQHPSSFDEIKLVFLSKEECRRAEGNWLKLDADIAARNLSVSRLQRS